MDGISPGKLGDADDFLDGEIGLDGAFAPADEIGFIRLEAVQGEFVVLGVDGDGGNAQLRRRAEHADGDLGPVCDQQAFKVFHELSSFAT